MATDDQDFYFDLAKFQATILTTRGSFMLVFQSMLLTTVAIVSGRTANPFHALKYLLVVGLITALVWLYMNYLTRCIEKECWAKLLKVDERVAAIAQKRPIFGWAGDIAWFMAYPFPVLLAVLWCVLLWLL